MNLDVPISYVTDNVMKSLSSLDTVTPMIGVCAKKENMVIGNRVLILDEVQDPGNMGTIIRSAVAFNIDTIILSENCADIYSPKGVRGSQGLLFYMDFVALLFSLFLLYLLFLLILLVFVVIFLVFRYSFDSFLKHLFYLLRRIF